MPTVTALRIKESLGGKRKGSKISNADASADRPLKTDQSHDFKTKRENKKKVFTDLP